MLLVRAIAASLVALALGACAAVPAASPRSTLPAARAADALVRTRTAAREVRAQELAARLAWVEARLREEQVYADRWRWGWVATFGALVAFNGVRAIAYTGGAREAGIVGGAGSLLGLASLLVLPPRASSAARELARFRDGPRGSTREQLRFAERLLREAAMAEDFTRSWLSQLGRAAVATALGVVLAAGFNRLDAAAINVGGGLVIGQLMVRTHPTGALEAWQRYAQRHPDAGPPLRRWGGLASSAAATRWSVAPQPGGVSVLVTF